MGIYNNEVVIATCEIPELILELEAWISNLPDRERQRFVSAPSVVNGFKTFVLVPDGSKKGWVTAEEGEILRNKFVEKLEQFAYDDGSNNCKWVEVGYGEYGQKVLRGNNKNVFNYKDYAV